VNLSDNLPAGSTGRSDREREALPLDRIVRRSVVDDVRAQLVALIESGRIGVNERLPSEAELARRFGVSRPIVREGLGRLRALGLTESRPGSGTFVASNVTKLTLSFGQYSAGDLNEVRRCIEVPAARRAANWRTAENIEEMKQALESQEVATTPEEAFLADGQFHCAIAKATGNKLFLRLIEDLREILQGQSLAVTTLRNRGAEAAVEHRKVVEAIIARDGEAAAAAMEEHLDAVEKAILRLAPKRARRTTVDEKKTPSD